MDPGFTAALDAMFKAAPGGMGITSGDRDPAQQAALHAKAEKEHPGQADQWAAPVGTSWHEKGLAADLRFASPAVLQWAHANAGRFGLFFPMAWEPWHVQPLWTMGRKSTDAPGLGGGTPPPAGFPGADAPTDPMGQALAAVEAAISGRNDEHPADGMTIAQRWGNVMGRPGQMAAAGTTGATAGVAAGALDYQARYNLVLSVGGTPDEARFLAAVADPESGGVPTKHNTNAGTGDNSYGIWQVNMLGNMGVERAQKYGLKSYDDLYDPMTNARAALDIYRGQGPEAWHNSLPKMQAHI